MLCYTIDSKCVLAGLRGVIWRLDEEVLRLEEMDQASRGLPPMAYIAKTIKAVT